MAFFIDMAKISPVNFSHVVGQSDPPGAVFAAPHRTGREDFRILDEEIFGHRPCDSDIFRNRIIDKQEFNLFTLCVVSGRGLCCIIGFRSQLMVGGNMRRLITLAFWMLILGWLIAWLSWATDKGQMPSGALWAMFSLTAWWIVGAASKEDKRRG
jgi:hypothetical protein